MKQRVFQANPAVLALSAIVLATTAGHSQTYAIARNQNIVVPAGKVCEILNFVQTGNPPNSCWLLLDGKKIFQAYGVDSDPFNQPAPKSFFVPGPATIVMQFGASATATCSFRVFANGTSVPVTNLPSNSVVIPTDATGPVAIVLESSVDLVTWTAADPGTYSPTVLNRFFRVRATLVPQP